jgi:sulfide:quinone oxidoreductase
MPYDLFLGIPKHRVPDVVAASGMTVDGWIPVDRKTLKTRFPNVYAVGDVTSVGTAKAGVFSEAAARVVAAEIIANVQGGEQPAAYQGAGTCYVEFGGDVVGRVDVDFLSGPSPTGSFIEPSVAMVDEKRNFGSSRRAAGLGCHEVSPSAAAVPAAGDVCLIRKESFCGGNFFRLRASGW